MNKNDWKTNKERFERQEQKYGSKSLFDPSVCVEYFCRKTGIPYKTYYRWLNKGLSREQIYAKRYGKNNKEYLSEWDNLKVTQFCRVTGIPNKTYYRNIKRGLTRKEMFLMQGSGTRFNENNIAETLKSLGVQFYKDIPFWSAFDRNGINFDWSKYPNIKNNRPDFTIVFNNTVGFIEEDDEGHFTILSNRRRDEIKQKFIEEMGYPLLRVRYDQMDRLEEIIKDYISNSSKYVKQHNPYLPDDEYWKISYNFIHF